MSAAENPVGPAVSRRAGVLPSLLLLAVACWVVLWFVHALGYWEDDAYIHLEFARSLSRGAGFSFNGHVVYGDTSPLWVWLLVGAHAAIPNWMVAGKTLTALAAVFSLAGVYRLARRLTRGVGAAASSLFAAAMLLLLVTNPYFGYWAFSGMEALLAAGLVCWALVAVGCEGLTEPLAPRHFLLGCMCAGVAPLLRPEMVFFTFLLGFLLFIRWVNMPVVFRAKLSLFFGGLLLVVGPEAAWALYAVRTFGNVLPNTDAAKRAGPADSVLRHLAQIYAFGFPLVVLGLALLVGWLLLRGLRESVRTVAVAKALPVGGWLLFVWTALNCLFYVINHTYVQTRYIFVTAPVLTVALLAIAYKLWPEFYRAGVVLGVLFGVVISLLTTWPLIRNKIGVDRVYADFAAELRSLPPSAGVAYYSIGEAAFLSEHPIIDTGGITRPGIIPYLWDTTTNRRLYWVHQQGAKYLVVNQSPEPGSTLIWSQPIPSTGWSLNPRRYRDTEQLELWKLPPSPTIPPPSEMPTQANTPFDITNH